MLDQMYAKLGLGYISGVVFLDLKKAFDTVDRNILLRKLKSIGASDQACSWFISYLRERKQTTKIDTTLSSMSPISHGVPQGSILGPLLFFAIRQWPPISGGILWHLHICWEHSNLLFWSRHRQCLPYKAYKALATGWMSISSVLMWRRQSLYKLLVIEGCARSRKLVSD